MKLRYLGRWVNVLLLAAGTGLYAQKSGLDDGDAGIVSATEPANGTPEPAESNAGVAEKAIAAESVAKSRPAFFNVGLGVRVLLPETNTVSDARQYATDNVIRSSEVIYKGSGVTLNEEAGSFSFVPAFRTEWEIPFENLGILKQQRFFSMLFSLEGGYSPERQLLTSSGNFRYQNAQAPNAALTDLTYNGSLTVTERHWNLTPMVGAQVDYTNGWLQQAKELHLLARLSVGVGLMSGQRTYDLALAPQYVSAGAYSDTYVIQSRMVQSYGMTALLAGRAELGGRFRLDGRLHLAVLFSLSVFYGYLPYENQGYFADRAGAAADRNIYQKIVSGSADQDYFALAPAVFLALSSEL